MPTLCAVVDAFVASREHDRATLARLAFWTEVRGTRELSAITPEDVDAALVRLAERGRLVPRRGKETLPAGAPLAGSTFNRYIAQLGSVYRYARRFRLPRFCPADHGHREGPGANRPEPLPAPRGG